MFSSFLSTFPFFWGEHTTPRFKIHRWKNYPSGVVLGVVLVGVGRCLVPWLNLFWFQSDTIDADVGKGGKCFGTKNTDNERDNEVAVKQHLPNMQHPKIQRGTKCLLLLCSIHDNTRNSIYPKQRSKKAAHLPSRSNCAPSTSLMRSKKPYRYRYLGKHFFANFLLFWIFCTVSN